MNTRRLHVSWLLGGAVLAFSLTLAGCVSPLSDNPDNQLRRSIAHAVERELESARRHPEPVTLTRESRLDELGIKPEFMRELEEMAGPERLARMEAPLGESVIGPSQDVVHVTLEKAIIRAVEYNLNVQFARLAPAIAESQVTAAEAAFDWVFFSNFNWSKTDQARSQSRIGNQPIGVSTDERQIVSQSVGVRKALITGGQVQVQHEFTYTDIETSGFSAFPDPAYESNIVLQLDQPLLRNAGSEVALSQVRLARNAERDEIEALRGELIRIATDVEGAYWALYRAHMDLKILQQLLERGIEVRDKVVARRVLDAKPAQIADAIARVERRSADVLRAQQALRDASDQLKLLMNDPELTIGSNTLLLPADATVDEAITYSFLDSVLTALRERPEVHRALLSIDNTSIRQDVADNQRLPRLDLRAQMRFNALGEDVNDAYREQTEGNFVDYLIGLAFEMPIGNREAEALFRQRRLERYQATAAYHNTVQNIVAEVLRSLRSVATNYVLIEQTRVARYAEAENLRTLQAEFEGVLPQTPELLAEQLRRQEALASAEQQEIGALVDYNIAIATLHAAMGTALERNRILFDVPDATDINEGYRLFPAYREPSPDERQPRAAAAAVGIQTETPPADEAEIESELDAEPAPVEPTGEVELVPSD